MHEKLEGWVSNVPYKCDGIVQLVTTTSTESNPGLQEGDINCDLTEWFKCLYKENEPLQPIINSIENMVGKGYENGNVIDEWTLQIEQLLMIKQEALCRFVKVVFWV